MKGTELINAASLIVKANLNEKVLAVTVEWDDQILKLFVTYYVNEVATDNSNELCELTVTELLAEFSDVKLAASKCIPVLGKSLNAQRMRSPDKSNCYLLIRCPVSIVLS